MNTNLKKLVVKGVIGLVGSALIGQLIKLERKIEDRIDDHFDEKAEQKN